VTKPKKIVHIADLFYDEIIQFCIDAQIAISDSKAVERMIESNARRLLRDYDAVDAEWPRGVWHQYWLDDDALEGEEIKDEGEDDGEPS
jgi:hypothetical protein